MPKVKVATLIDRYLAEVGHPGIGQASSNAYRQAALFELQKAEKWIHHQGSFRYLATDSTIVLNNGLDLVNIPSDCDIGKTTTIFLPGGGTLDYQEDETLANKGRYTYGAWGVDRPSAWRWSSTTAGIQQIKFDRTNTSGAPITYPINYHRRCASLVDDASSESSLPETYEETLLLKRAIITGKQSLRQEGWQSLLGELVGQDGQGGELATFFDAYRSSKAKPIPDGEGQRKEAIKRESGS